MAKKKKPVRAGVRRATRKDSPTASAVRSESMPPHPPPHEQWATVALPDRFSGGKYRLCLWGDKASAVENCDTDERVCRVLVEVVEMLSPPGCRYAGTVTIRGKFSPGL
jgi:hypothetical protein